MKNFRSWLYSKFVRPESRLEEMSRCPTSPAANMKLNLGCGHRRIDGYINVDKYDTCSPDQIWDLEVVPWPWATDSIGEILLIHSLEHIGQESSVFLNIIKEIYRVCRDGAIVTVHVPHPRHDDFIGDPTHVRPITPQQLMLFDKRLNDEWKAAGSSAATPLAHYLGVNFAIIESVTLLAEPYHSRYVGGMMTLEEVNVALREKNNVASEFHIKLKVLK